jgi:hypothetical protein
VPGREFERNVIDGFCAAVVFLQAMDFDFHGLTLFGSPNGATENSQGWNPWFGHSQDIKAPTGRKKLASAAPLGLGGG